MRVGSLLRKDEPCSGAHANGAGLVSAGLHWQASDSVRPDSIDHDILHTPGLLRQVAGRIESAQPFIVDAGRIVAVFIMRNPDKLASVPQCL
jgi:RNA polymerase sigma-70 factor (ECF subfamily)